MKNYLFYLPLFIFFFVFSAVSVRARPPDTAREAAPEPQYIIEVEVNKLERGSGKDGSYPWNDAVAYCRGLTARLPIAEELRRIYSAQCRGGRRGDTCKRWYWSSDEDGGEMAFGMRFYDGDMHSGSKYSVATGMLCVRGWAEADAYCRANNKRLPTPAELRRIYAAECKKKRTGYCGFWYWSAEGSAASGAKGINFVSGALLKMGKESATSAVICVPPGKAGK